MIKLILVRHALTDDNKNNKLSGSIDSSVSKEGIVQIQHLTKFLNEMTIDKIYTTTSSRTKDTIKDLAKAKSIDIIESSNLKEINFGDFEGMDFRSIKSKYPREFEKMVSKGYEYRYPNGESLIDTYERVKREVDKIVLEDRDENIFNKDKNILICSHGGTIRNIIAYLIGNSYKFHWNFKIDNASVSILEIDNGFTVMTMMNNTSFINIKSEY